MIYISIGSNEGNRLDALQQAFTLLKNRCLKNIRSSIVLETEAIMPDGAPTSWNKPFLNMIISGRSDLEPEQLLAELKCIERTMGRPAQYDRWAPRVIDLDILLWDNITLETQALTIPHPELNNRPFLLHLLALMGVKHLQSRLFSPCFLKSFVLSPKLVGIVNITMDSFSDGGQFNVPKKAIDHALQLAKEGASIVEIGAQSTRPGAVMQSPESEYSILEPVLDGLMPWVEAGFLRISVDTFSPIVIQRVLNNYPVAWINDVKGDLDDITLKLIREQGCHLCIMHSLDIPPKQQRVLSVDCVPVDIIKKWAENKIERLLDIGFKQENIIIDPGIGFGKSAYQSIQLLRDLTRLKKLHSPILVGHSRKSYIEAFSTTKASERDLDTLAVSASIQHTVDFLRVHNIKDHMTFLVGSQVIAENYI